MNKPDESTSMRLLDETDQQQAFAEKVLRVEADAVSHIQIDGAFHHAVQLILDATSGGKSGTVVVSGLGKSGLIGQKISATFASTGTPSHALHPVEAMHGDLGRVRRGDVVVTISSSGSTAELVALVTVLRQDDVTVIAIVARSRSDIARLATVTLCTGDVTEACPLNLAPTASTTAMLALGDALALTVSRRREFRIEDFRKVHPGGALGRQLMSIMDAMRLRAGVNLPVVRKGRTIAEALVEAEKSATRRVGACLIIDEDGKLAGIFTDADLRRLVVRSKDLRGAFNQPIETVMTVQPHCLLETDLVRDAVQMAREFRCDEFPVVDADGQPLGLIDVQDLVALKVIEG